MPALFALGVEGDRQPGHWPRSPRSGRSPCCCSSTSAARCASGCRTRSRWSSTGAVFVVPGHAGLARRPGWPRWPWLVVAFCVLFAGVVSSVLAGASTSLLLAFILPVSLPGPVELDPGPAGRLGAGRRGLADRDQRCCGPPRRAIRCADRRSAACRRWPAGCGPRSRSPRSGAARSTAAETAQRLGRGQDRPMRPWPALRTSFFATPYRPTGLTTAARDVVRLVDELVWLDADRPDAPSPADRGAGRRRGVRGQARPRPTLLDAGADAAGREPRGRARHAATAALRPAARGPRRDGAGARPPAGRRTRRPGDATSRASSSPRWTRASGPRS